MIGIPFLFKNNKIWHQQCVLVEQHSHDDSKFVYILLFV